MGRSARTLAVLVLSAILLTTFGLATADLPTRHAEVAKAVGGVQQLNVSVSDAFAFVLSANEITPGDTVKVTLTYIGTGGSAHTFTLSPIPDFQFNGSDATPHLLSFFAAHHPLVNLSENGTTGESHSQTFVAPAYGLYEYVCLESGHFSLGMFGLLGSGEAGSGGSVATGPGWQVFAIIGGIASLVVATIVLAFVFGQREGSKHEMPPERLGYPEAPKEPATPHP